MNLLGVPIKFRHLRRTVGEWLVHLRHSLFTAERDTQINFVYFSCQRDYQYLILSLRSLLANVTPRLIARLFIYEDAKDPFTADQIAALCALSPHVHMRKVRNFSWASPETTFAEVSSFLAAAAEARDTDYLAKVDSDIMFLSSAKLHTIMKLARPFAGDGHYSSYRYAQGGLYFMRVAELKQAFSSLNLEEIREVSRRLGFNAEDRVISEIFRNRGHPPCYSRMMLFPNEYGQLSQLNKFVRWEFCAAHFVKDKDSMAAFAAAFGVIRNEERPDDE